MWEIRLRISLYKAAACLCPFLCHRPDDIVEPLGVRAGQWGKYERMQQYMQDAIKHARCNNICRRQHLRSGPTMPTGSSMQQYNQDAVISLGCNVRSKLSTNRKPKKVSNIISIDFFLFDLGFSGHSVRRTGWELEFSLSCSLKVCAQIISMASQSVTMPCWIGWWILRRPLLATAVLPTQEAWASTPCIELRQFSTRSRRR